MTNTGPDSQEPKSYPEEVHEGLLEAIREKAPVWVIINNARVGDVIEPLLESLKAYGFKDVTVDQFAHAKNYICLNNIRCPEAPHIPIR